MPIVNLMWYWYSIQKKNDELLLRRENQVSLVTYELNNEDVTKGDVEDASNFKYIKQIFSMENRQYLELRKDFRNEIKKLKDEICPVGTIQAFSFRHIPDGWMVCDGRMLSIDEYPLLYNAIGKTYGSDSDGNFLIPDLCGRFVRGWDSKGGIDIERIFGSCQEDAFQTHAHILKVEGKLSDEGSHSHSLYFKKSTIKYGTNTFSSDSSALLMEKPVDWNEYYDHKYGKYNWWASDYDSHSLSSNGSHTHNLPDFSVMEPKSCSMENHVRVCDETRPKNVALLFCIKFI